MQNCSVYEVLQLILVFIYFTLALVSEHSSSFKNQLIRKMKPMSHMNILLLFSWRKLSNKIQYFIMLLYFRVSQNQVGQHFTFVLTDIESKQRFGFCRLTSGGTICLCILRWVFVVKKKIECKIGNCISLLYFVVLGWRKTCFL